MNLIHLLALPPGGPPPGGPAGPAGPSPSPSPTASALGGNVFTSSFLLSALIWAPVVVALVVAFVPVPRRLTWIWQWCAFWTQMLLVAVLTLIAYIQFAAPTGPIMFEEKLTWLPAIGISYHLGVDGIGITMLLLNALVTISAILVSGVRERERSHYVLLLLVQSAVVGVVSARDLALMLLFLGSLILPVGLLIQGWGGPGRAIAARRFMAHAALGVAMLVAAVLLYYVATGGSSFDLDSIFLNQATPRIQVIAGAMVLIGAACWLPLVPFHGWVRTTLTEASPGVAILIAGLVSRLGGYVLLRVLVGGLHDGARLLAPLVALLAALTVVHGALGAIRRDDVRRVSAYLAMVPGGMVALGVAGLTPLSLAGAAMGLLLGGVAAAMVIGSCAVIAERAHSRRLAVLGGLFGRMPFLGWLLVLAALGILGAPFGGTYISELMTLLGSFGSQPVGSIGVLVGVAFAGVALAWLLYRLLFGAPVADAPVVSPASLSERWGLVVLAAASLWFGILPAGPKPGGVPIALDPGLATVVTYTTADLSAPYVPQSPNATPPGGAPDNPLGPGSPPGGDLPIGSPGGGSQVPIGNPGGGSQAP